MKPLRVHAFTLIELLITVAITAVLAALVTGVTSSLMSGGKEAKSIGQLRQIATAIHGYANDNQDNFPRGYFFLSGQPELSYITELLPYLDEQPSPLRPSRNIFISPSSALPMPVKAAGATIPTTYSVHGLLCPDTSTGKVPMKRSMVNRPGQVILIGDAAQNPSSKNALFTLKSPSAFAEAGSSRSLDELIPVGADADTNAGLGQLRYRSNGHAVVAMVDGHVARMKKGTVTYANVIADR